MKSGKWIKLVLTGLTVMTLAFSSAEDSFAGKAQFKAGITPPTLSLSVNSQGGITGTKTVKMDIHRIQVGSSYACNKIQTVQVLRGGQPVPLDTQKVLLTWAGFPKNRGRCYFDINLTVQPFSDDEIRGACQNASGAQSLVAEGMVTAWNKDPSYIDYIRHLRSTGGTGGLDPKSRAPVTFAANVTCGTGGGSRIYVPPITPPGGVTTTSGGAAGNVGGSTQCDLTGTWNGFNNGTRGEGWKFSQIFTSGGAVTYRATHLSPQGSLTSLEGTMVRAQSGNYLFYTLATSIPGAGGAYQASTMKSYDADASCSKLTQRQLANSTSGMFVQPGNYWLQRVGAPLSPVRSKVGRPIGRTNTFRPRKAPTMPGDTYQPGPNTPRPGTMPKWPGK
ncbi:MAG: hypothetical protein GXP52_05580 [Deltaproteobacteria bacterium]|nr:hypothetical protein [Deltaproteobacteria bacterium]